ncbi:MAG: caspase family protein [Polyangiales bacterium]
MKRTAVIIGSPQQPAPPLPGVAVDHRAWREFLTSPHGGAWEHDEVFDLPGVDAATDLFELGVLCIGVEFAVVVFSGHGAHDAVRGDYVTFGNRMDVELARLRVAVPRLMLIVDACRVFEPMDVSSPPRTAGKIAEAAGIPPAYRESCRAAYDRSALGQPAGVMLMQSCSPGEKSSDHDQLGGLFTYFLLEYAKSWAIAVDPRASTRTVRGAAASFRDAHGVLVNMTANELPENRQTPMLKTTTPSPDYPFAVA